MTTKKQAQAIELASKQATAPDGGNADPTGSVSRPRTEQSSTFPPSGDFIDLIDLRITKPTNNAESVITVGAGIQFGMKCGGGIVQRIYCRPTGGPVFVDIADPVTKAYKSTATVFVGSGEFGTLKTG
jgi:hypothetical protein